MLCLLLALFKKLELDGVINQLEFMKKNKITTPLFFINHRIPSLLMVDLVAVRKIHTECSKSVVKHLRIQ